MSIFKNNILFNLSYRYRINYEVRNPKKEKKVKLSVQKKKKSKKQLFLSLKRNKK